MNRWINEQMNKYVKIPVKYPFNRTFFDILQRQLLVIISVLITPSTSFSHSSYHPPSVYNTYNFVYVSTRLPNW